MTVSPAGPTLIGVTTYRERARWGIWDIRADVLPAAYADAVEVAGAVPVLLPPPGPTGDVEEAPEGCDSLALRARAVVARIDGLVVSGGADVAPHRYDATPHDRTTGWREDRDGWELALLDAAAEVDLPVLGICRGMQVMAIHAGGLLEQHVPDRVGDDRHSPGGDVFGDVEVDLAEGSAVAALVGARTTVACHHHQAVASHPGFEPVAWAADGTLEAMERHDRAFWVAVQWHPEMITDDAGLLTGLVRAAQAGQDGQVASR